mmetsp:Transcript_18541/g.22783  ORF Transcript_18541/g.22783 Transcript_18541/m.22783 type:complete len:453 (+) Transcript_18541:97-1455(+)
MKMLPVPVNLEPEQECLTLSELRAAQAQKWVDGEIEKLLSIMHEVGIGNGSKFRSKQDVENLRIRKFSKTKLHTTFGELFDVYHHVSDSLVGMLMRARKRKLVTFEGGILFQGKDDHVVLTLEQGGIEFLRENSIEISTVQNNGMNQEKIKTKSSTIMQTSTREVTDLNGKTTKASKLSFTASSKQAVNQNPFANNMKKTSNLPLNNVRTTQYSKYPISKAAAQRLKPQEKCTQKQISKTKQSTNAKTCSKETVNERVHVDNLENPKSQTVRTKEYSKYPISEAAGQRLKPEGMEIPGANPVMSSSKRLSNLTENSIRRKGGKYFLSGPQLRRDTRTQEPLKLFRLLELLKKEENLTAAPVEKSKLKLNQNSLGSRGGTRKANCKLSDLKAKTNRSPDKKQGTINTRNQVHLAKNNITIRSPSFVKVNHDSGCPKLDQLLDMLRLEEQLSAK